MSNRLSPRARVPRIDLRSDTVTRPTEAMREAMARAEVGDNVYDEDPTVRALEERAAALFGVEAALYVPSGTMANQIALKIHTQPGDDVIAGQFAHSYLYEGGASAAWSGVQFTLVGQSGLFTVDEARAAIKPDDHHFAPTSLIMAENTHNRSGGRVFPLEELRGLRSLADEHGFGFHIDGARILNASVARGTPPSAYGEVAHTLSLCLSKGLGAPVGSLIMGSAQRMDRAHRFRGMLGGAMRQCGIIAAGGLFALEHHIERLADDHRRARRFAEGLAATEGVRVDLDMVETNIVVFDVTRPSRTAADVVGAAAERGLGFFDLSERSIRAVFHLGIDDEQTEEAVAIVEDAVAGDG